MGKLLPSFPKSEHTSGSSNTEPARVQYDQWSKTNTPKALRAVVDALEPTLNSAITTYAGMSSPLVHSRARLLAAKAIKTFDPSRNTSLKSHVMRQLQPITRYATQAAQPLKMSERNMLALRTLLDAESSLSGSLGREPTDVELADHLGWSQRVISKVRAYNAPIISATGRADEDSDPSVSSTDPAAIWLDYVYYDADPIDKKIIEWRTGKAGSVLGTNEMARRLRISPAAVTQRINKLQSKINEGLDLERQR